MLQLLGKRAVVVGVIFLDQFAKHSAAAGATFNETVIRKHVLPLTAFMKSATYDLLCPIVERTRNQRRVTPLKFLALPFIASEVELVPQCVGQRGLADLVALLGPHALLCVRLQTIRTSGFES